MPTLKLNENVSAVSGLKAIYKIRLIRKLFLKAFAVEVDLEIRKET